MRRIFIYLVYTGLLLVGLAGFAEARDQVDNTVAPPGNNVPFPILEKTNQVKIGNLGVDAFGAFGDTLLVNTAIFKGFFSGISVAGQGNKSNLYFGGKVSPTQTISINLLASGNIYTDADFYADNIKTSGGQRKLCADNDGIITFCDPVVEFASVSDWRFCANPFGCGGWAELITNPAVCMDSTASVDRTVEVRWVRKVSYVTTSSPYTEEKKTNVTIPSNQLCSPYGAGTNEQWDTTKYTDILSFCIIPISQNIDVGPYGC